MIDTDNLTTDDVLRLRAYAVTKEDHVVIEICDEARRGMDEARPGYRSWPTLVAMRHVVRLLSTTRELNQTAWQHLARSVGTRVAHRIWGVVRDTTDDELHEVWSRPADLVAFCEARCQTLVDKYTAIAADPLSGDWDRQDAELQLRLLARMS